MSEDLSVPPVDATLKRIVVAYRVLAFVWLSALVTSTLATDDGADRVWVVAAWVAATVSTLMVVGSAKNRRRLTSAPLLVADIAISAFIGVSPGLAGSVDLFSGGYLLATLLLVVYARPSFGVGAISVAIFAATSITVPVLSDARTLRATDAAGDVAAFVVTTAVFGWGMEVIRRSERLRMSAEQALTTERMLRARADDRAEIGDHLHDSVLQTLALIQQRCTDPAEVAHLARRQGRELRRFIDQMSSDRQHSLRAALRDAAAEIEDLYRITVDAVVVGDRELDTSGEAAVKAVSEALANAAKHSGCDEISLYAELAGPRPLVFVRDRGPGFDPDRIDDGHRGIRESIVGRMERHGGTATIRSSPGRGTEIEISFGGVRG